MPSSCDGPGQCGSLLAQLPRSRGWHPLPSRHHTSLQHGSITLPARLTGWLCTIHHHIHLSCLQGEAYAHWRMAQPALSFLGVSKGKLQTIEALLNPNVWKAAAAESSAILGKHLKQVVTEIKQASLQAGYLWGSQIAGCKLGNTDISSLSVGGAAAATAASEVVAAADVLVDVAAASAAVAEPTPAAAAMAALMATPANPEGIVVDANALVVDADGQEEAP